jgi:hypothetical protein
LTSWSREKEKENQKNHKKKGDERGRECTCTWWLQQPLCPAQLCETPQQRARSPRLLRLMTARPPTPVAQYGATLANTYIERGWLAGSTGYNAAGHLAHTSTPATVCRGSPSAMFSPRKWPSPRTASDNNHRSRARSGCERKWV